MAEDEDLDFIEKSGLSLGIDDARIVTDFAVGASGVGPVMGFDSGDFFPYADPALDLPQADEGDAASA